MSELAVQGCSLKISSTAGDISAVSVVPSNSPSSDNLINNKGVFFDKITAQITIATITPTTPIAGTTNTGILASDSIDILGTANNVLDSNNKKAVQVTIEVEDTGQTDVIAS